MLRAAVICCATVAVANGAGFEAWVDSHGGAIERDGGGEIVAVDLAHSWITDADLGRVAALGRLERLDLSGTRISDSGLELLAPLEGVRELRLRFAEHVSEGGVAYLRGWAGLEVLDLRGTQVRSRVFEHLAALSRLRRLDVSHTRITDDGFERLAELAELTTLAIGSNRLDGAALDHARLFRGLRSLSVAGVQRVDSGIWGLALNPANLERLGRLSQLETLDLAGATITDVGSDRPGRPDAERQSLPGLEALAALENLRELSLARQPVATEGLRWLSALPELRRLNLGGCARIGDEALGLLGELPKLESVYLPGTAVSSGAVKRLGQRRRGLRVEWYDSELLRERRTAQ